MIGLQVEVLTMAEYIEREAIKYEQWTVGPFYKPIMVVRKKTIDNIPAADVAPVRHGRWEVEVGMNFFKERNCPVCKKRIESNFWNFCPNCGTKMDLEG